MIITRATDYSIRALLHMAERYPARVVSKEEMCRAERVSPAFLTKILQPLIRGGLVLSRRGAKGGFALARDPSKTTVLDVMRAVEEPFDMNFCIAHDGRCEFAATCPVRDLWREAQLRVEEVFASRTLADLARERVRRHRRQSARPGAVQVTGAPDESPPTLDKPQALR